MPSSDAVTALRAEERGIITQIASMIVAQAKSLSSWSQHISSSFNISPVTELPDGMMITVGNSAPEALAFERGSGIHGPTGEKYEIVPKNASMLSFPGTHGFGNTYSSYNRSTKEGMGAKNWVLTPIVHHPGVAARPFLHPANEAVRPIAMEMLKQAVGDSVRLTIREMWNKNA
jgi:hypothetical protein